MSTELHVEKVQGAKIADHFAALARLRMTIFREFPYLYDGNKEYEARYLQTYISSPDSLAVMVYEGDKAVAAATCLPLAHEVADLKQPFVQAGYDVDKLFYFAESMALPEYRGRGLGVRFFYERELYARELGRFDTICFCAVQRPVDHPRRPPNYAPLDRFWRHRGFEKQASLHTTFTWKDLDETKESGKPMIFWTKVLKP